MHFLALLLVHSFESFLAFLAFLPHQSEPFASSHGAGGGGGAASGQMSHVASHFLALPLAHSFESFFAFLAFLAHHSVPLESSHPADVAGGGGGAGCGPVQEHPEQSHSWASSRTEHVYLPSKGGVVMGTTIQAAPFGAETLAYISG